MWLDLASFCKGFCTCRKSYLKSNKWNISQINFLFLCRSTHNHQEAKNFACWQCLLWWVFHPKQNINSYLIRSCLQLTKQKHCIRIQKNIRWRSQWARLDERDRPPLAPIVFISMQFSWKICLSYRLDILDRHCNVFASHNKGDFMSLWTCGKSCLRKYMVGIEKLSKTITKKHAGPCEPSPNYIEGFRISQMGGANPKGGSANLLFWSFPPKTAKFKRKKLARAGGGRFPSASIPSSPMRK